MSGYVALLRLQLQSRFAGLRPQALKQSLLEKKWKTLGFALLYLFAFGSLAVMLILMEIGLVDGLIAMGMQDTFLTLAIMMAMISTLILGFFFIMSSLYFGKDSAFLAALPIKSRTLLAARLTQVWIGEAGISAIFIIPAAIIYGLKTGQNALFYVRGVLVWLALPVLPMVIVTLVSTVLIRISGLWKRRERVAMVGGIIFFIGYMYACMSIGGMTGEAAVDETFIVQLLSNNKQLITLLTTAFPPAGWAALGMLGDLGKLFIYLGVCALGAGLTVYFVGFFYQRLSLLQSEVAASSKKRINGKQSYAATSQLRACMQRELREIMRVPAYMMNSLPTAVMPPLMIVFMAMSFSRSGGDGMDIGALLGEISPAIVLAALTGIMALFTGINPAVASAVTREGKHHGALRCLPVSPETLVRAKLFAGLILSSIGTFLGMIVLFFMLPQYAVETVLAFIIGFLYGFVCCALGLANDIARPQMNWQTETEAIKQKANTMISMVISWVLLIALGVLSFFLISAGLEIIPFAAILIAILVALSMLANLLLTRMAKNTYSQIEG